MATIYELCGCGPEPQLNKEMRFLLYAAAAYALAPQQHSAALDAVERAVDAAVASTSQPIEALPPAERESVAIARRLQRRLDSWRLSARDQRLETPQQCRAMRNPHFDDSPELQACRQKFRLLELERSSRMTPRSACPAGARLTLSLPQALLAAARALRLRQL